MVELLIRYWNICEKIAIGLATVGIAVTGLVLIGILIVGAGSLVINIIRTGD